MKTDWQNYRQLGEDEVIRYGDEILMPDSEEWDELPTDRIGTKALDPLMWSHCKYRRRIKLKEDTGHE